MEAVSCLPNACDEPHSRRKVTQWTLESFVQSHQHHAVSADQLVYHFHEIWKCRSNHRGPILSMDSAP